MAVLTVHHWDDWEAGLAELCRVAPRRLVVAIDFEPHARFWLYEDYLPPYRAAVNAGVSAATAREGFRLADASVTEECGERCSPETAAGR